jgi:hypothetical protein
MLPKLGRGVLVAAVLVISAGCQGAADNPVAPRAAVATHNEGTSAFGSESASGLSTAKVDICHSTGRANHFILITVAESAVAAHLAHGDGHIGDPVPRMEEFDFDENCTPMPGAIIYDFSAPCVSIFGDGCAAVGLSDGDPVTGRLSFARNLVVPGEDVGFDASTPGVDFSFTYGTVSLSKNNLQPSPPFANSVSFSLPDAESLSGIAIAGIDLSFLGDGFLGFFSHIGDTVIVSLTTPDGLFGNSRAIGFWVRR